MRLSKKQIIIAITVAVIAIAAVTAAIIVGVGSKKPEPIQNTETEKDTTKTITDNGITISGKLGKAVRLKSEQLKEDSDAYKEVAERAKSETLVALVATDVKLVDEKDKEVQPDGKAAVTMTIPDSLVSGDGYQYDKANDTYKVYTKSKSGINELDGELSKDGKTITFETSYVSNFAVAKENSDRAIENVEKEVAPLDKTMTVSADTVVYAGPDTTYDEVAKVATGQDLKVTGQYQKNQWYKVQVSDTQSGYVDPNTVADKQEEPVQEQPAEEPTNTDNSNNGASANAGNESSNNNSGSSKKNDKKNQTASNGNGGGNQSSSGQSQQPSDEQSQEPIPQPQAPSNPKAGVAETLYDGSVGGGITGEQKAHIDGLVRSWLNGGYSNDGLANEIGNYLMGYGYTVNGFSVVKDSKILIPSGSSYSLGRGTTGNELYYYGKLTTDGNMEGDSRVGYEARVRVY